MAKSLGYHTRKEQFFLGTTLPMDLFILFAQLSGYTCCACSGTVGYAMSDVPEGIFGMDMFAVTIVDTAGRPVGVACLDCMNKFHEFVYTDLEQTV